MSPQKSFEADTNKYEEEAQFNTTISDNTTLNQTFNSSENQNDVSRLENEEDSFKKDDFDEEEEEEECEEHDDRLEIDVQNEHDQDTKLQEEVNLDKSQTAKATINEYDDLSCKICNKQFDNLHRLQRHMLSHDMNPDLRKFKCEYCNKAFKFKHHLKVSLGLFYFFRPIE
jgi:hypothetical protein